jgi:hypothetical protein
METQYRKDIYLDKIIEKDFSTTLMNDSKWVKLIATLIKNSVHIKECRVKPIWDDTSKRKLLVDENKQFEIDFYKNSMESMVSGNPKGWYAYKEIEWLDFPKFIEADLENEISNHTEQDLLLIKSIIEEAGSFFMETSDSNLRLYAYVRKKKIGF